MPSPNSSTTPSAEFAALFLVQAPAPLVPAQHFDGTRLAESRFSFYGECFTLGATINWEANPGSWHWGHDLNRFGFLVLYEANRSLQNAELMLGLIQDWIEKNGCVPRPGSPYAWQNLLNVAIRMENWWRFLGQTIGDGHVDAADSRTRLVFRGVVRHTLITLKEIRKRGFGDNWSLIGLRAGLFILYSIEIFPHRSMLIAIARSYLRRALDKQILPDGVQQELSPHYHWVALELIASMAAMSRQAGHALDAELDDGVAGMARLLDALASPSGAIVALGDSDADYGPRIWSFLEELRRKTGLARLRASSCEVVTFPYAGLASVRHHATRSLLVFDGGPFGTGHQHEDALALWFTAFGVDLIVDPGRYLYEKGPVTFYAYLRSTAAHSTIRVDGYDQNARAAPLGWRRHSPGSPFVVRGDALVLTAAYTSGYGPQSLPVEHERTIDIRDDGLTLLVRDYLKGEGAHRIEQFWQISPGPWQLNGRTFQAERSGVVIRMMCESNPAMGCRVAEGERDPYLGWYSSGLNKITPSPTVVVDGQLTLPALLETRITASVLRP